MYKYGILFLVTLFSCKGEPRVVKIETNQPILDTLVLQKTHLPIKKELDTTTCIVTGSLSFSHEYFGEPYYEGLKEKSFKEQKAALILKSVVYKLEFKTLKNKLVKTIYTTKKQHFKYRITLDKHLNYNVSFAIKKNGYKKFSTFNHGRIYVKTLAKKTDTIRYNYNYTIYTH